MQNILITGVSTGIGYKLLEFFYQKEYHVFGSVRKQADASRLKAIFPEHFTPLVFDVTDKQAIEQAAETVNAKCSESGLACLINNAGIAVNGPLQHLPIEKLKHQLDVNVIGLVQVTQAFLPLLGASKNAKFPPGKIFNIGSVSGRFVTPFLGPYCASKYAVEAISDSLRRELLVYGIGVVLIEPGPVKSEIWQKAIDEFDDYPGTDYHPIIKNFTKNISKTAEKAIPAQKIADVIYRALLKKNPQTRYLVVKHRLAHWILINLVPDKLVDFAVKRVFRKFI